MLTLKKRSKPARWNSNASGITVVEIIVAIAVFALLVIVLSQIISAMQQSQRSEHYLDLSNAAAKAIIEDARNGRYDELDIGVVYDRTSMIPDVLPSGTANLTVTAFSSPSGGKTVKARVTYMINSQQKIVEMTALLTQSY